MKLGLLAGVEANPEHAEQVEAILRNAVELATQEQNTVSRLSFHESATTVGVFNTVADDKLGYAPEPVRPQDTRTRTHLHADGIPPEPRGFTSHSATQKGR